MKKAWKYILWILGIAIWFFFITPFWASDMTHGTNTHQIIILITGICLALYIWKKTGSGAKELEKENQELKAEVQKLRQELEQMQTVQRVIEKTESREKD